MITLQALKTIHKKELPSVISALDGRCMLIVSDSVKSIIDKSTLKRGVHRWMPAAFELGIGLRLSVSLVNCHEVISADYEEEYGVPPCTQMPSNQANASSSLTCPFGLRVVPLKQPSKWSKTRWRRCRVCLLLIELDELKGMRSDRRLRLQSLMHY